MDKHAFEAAKAAFDPVKVEKNFKMLYNDRKKFTKYFTRERILSMRLDDYVEGKGAKDLTNFCYAVEWALENLGKIQESTSIKFGVYYSKKKKQYVYAQKYGNNCAEAFEVIKHAIVDLIEAGARKDIEAIKSNILSPMFKGKILYLYYPDKYLNVFAERHVNYFITELGCDVIGCSKMDVVEKRDLLLDFKNADEDMREWSIDMFTKFLYDEYPKSPERFNGKQEGGFELLDNVEFVDLDYLVNKKGPASSIKIAGKIDYESKQHSLKELGNRGERM